MVETAQNCFLLPRCNKEFPRDIGKGRPCLNAHIGKCMAVCSGKITCEAYNEAVQGALRMIRYGKKDIVKQLKESAGETINWKDFVNKDYDRANANTGTRAEQIVPYNFLPLPEPTIIDK